MGCLGPPNCPDDRRGAPRRSPLPSYASCVAVSSLEVSTAADCRTRRWAWFGPAHGRSVLCAMIRRHETAAVAARDMKAGVVPYPTAGGGIEGQFEVAGCASRVEAEVHGSHEKTDKKGMERPDGTQRQFTSAGVVPTGTGRSRGASVAMSFCGGGPGSHVSDMTPIWHPRRFGTHGDRHTARNTHQHGDIAAEAG